MDMRQTLEMLKTGLEENFPDMIGEEGEAAFAPPFPVQHGWYKAICEALNTPQEIPAAINLVADREMIVVANTQAEAIERLDQALKHDGADECEIRIKAFHLKLGEVHAF